MDYTLISSLGTGMYKKDGGYRNTTYIFPNGKEIEAKLFLNAILQSGYKNIKKIILIGTRTSSWDVLLDENIHEDLWLKTRDEIETNDGITKGTLEEIEKIVSKEKNIEVAFKVHTQNVDSDSVQEIFDVYNTVANDLKPRTKILFDITHGFRSMPILIYQSLQFEAIKSSLENIELIYGEYIDLQKKSYVRDLSKYWELSEITSALNEFTAKLDGRRLAEKLKPYWERGAKAIERLSDIVALNFSLQIYDLLSQLKNSLNEDLTKSPNWVKNVKNEIKKIYNRLNKLRVSEVLYEYALLLEEKGLYTQSVIALQVCVETIAAEHAGLNYDKLGDYNWIQTSGRAELDKIKRTVSWKTRENIKSIEHFRNQIAHGGAKDRNTGKFPSASNLKTILNNGKNAVKEILK